MEKSEMKSLSYIKSLFFEKIIHTFASQEIESCYLKL